MDHEKLFTTKDLHKAEIEYLCAFECITRLETSLREANFKEVKQTAVDLLNSIRELEKYHQNFLNEEKINHFVTIMREKGIDVEKISRKIEVTSA